MKVKDLMSTEIMCIKENTPIIQAAAYMKQHNVGSLPVCDDSGHIKGILTDRDIVLRVLAKLDNSNGTTEAEDIHHLLKINAADIMSKNIITVSPDTNIHDAALLFSFHKIRRLPVTEASRIVGMLSLGDIAVKSVYIDEAGDVLSAISLADGQQ